MNATLDSLYTPTAADFAQAGYLDLITVVPPQGAINPASELQPESRGKVPGRRLADGTYVGYDWRHAAPSTPEAVADWADASVGLRCDRFPAIDIDCLDPLVAGLVESIALRILGPAPKRIGRAPKRLLLYRTRAPMRRLRLWIDGGDLVEILGAGQQCVVSGIHPGTGQPYRWPQGIEDATGLTEISPDQIDTFLSEVEDALDMVDLAHSREGSHLAGDRLDVDQRSLQSSMEHVRAVMAALPNDNDHFAGRDKYIAVGYAVKAAVGEAGWPLFKDWAMKWPGNARFPGGNDGVRVRQDWVRFKGPFEIGVDFLDDLHRQLCPKVDDMLTDDFAHDTPAASAEAQDSEPPRSSGGVIAFSEAHLAQVLAERHGEHIRYAVDRREWAAWDGHRWQRDIRLGAQRMAGAICLEYSALALKTIKNAKKAEAIAYRLASMSAKKNVVAYGADDPALQVTGEAFDTNKRWINTPSGVVDLETGEHLVSTPTMMQSRITAVSPAPGTPTRWLAFLKDATRGDAALQAYLQRLAGYALTGETRENCVAFLYGGGGNGKSVFLDTLMAVAGEYGRTSAASTFTASRSDRHSVEIADLAGARMVVANETRKNQKWDEERVKSLTGGGKITARFLYGQPFEFTPQFTLIFAGNDMPELDGLDPAMRRRLHIVPFTNKPAHPNRQLADQLVDEYPQILQWMIDGARAWYADGLGQPAAVAETTDQYFDDQDPFSRWAEEALTLLTPKLAETTQAHDETRVRTQLLFENWTQWCSRNHAREGTVNAFSRSLGQLAGVRRWRNTGGRGFSGLTIKSGFGVNANPDEAWA